MTTDPSAPSDDPDAALRAARDRFVALFQQRFESLLRSLEAIGGPEHDAAAESLRHVVHKMAGLAGLIGMPLVGERAQHLEELLSDEASPSPAVLRDAVLALQSAFELDLTRTADESSPEPMAKPDSRGTIVIVEDDADQRGLVANDLRHFGYTVFEVDRGDRALEVIRQRAPRVVLLDIDLPGIDGFSVCRQIKTDPVLRTTAVVFTTARCERSDRISGLTLGADDYLVKPIDRAELRLRLEMVLRRTAAAVATTNSTPLSYAAFAATAAIELARAPAAIALLRTPRGGFDATAELLASNLRRRDAIGRYDESHAVVMLPGMTAAGAADRLRDMTQQSPTSFQAGVVATAAAGSETLDTLVARADEALAEARYTGDAIVVYRDKARTPLVAKRTTIVVAEDEPDIARIIDAQLQSAGYTTMLAFDGRKAIELISTGAPDAVVLDLMMPGLTGFDVLGEMRQLTVRPRVVVVSARGREADVVRAFELGADDYIVKPFSPQEMLVRLSRLLR